MNLHEVTFHLEFCVFDFKVKKLNGDVSFADLLPQFSDITAHAVHVNGEYSSKVQVNTMQSFAIKSSKLNQLEVYGVTSDSMPILNSLVKHFKEKGYFGEGVLSSEDIIHGTFVIIDELPPVLAKMAHGPTYSLYIIVFHNKMCLSKAAK